MTLETQAKVNQFSFLPSLFLNAEAPCGYIFAHVDMKEIYILISFGFAAGSISSGARQVFLHQTWITWHYILSIVDNAFLVFVHLAGLDGTTRFLANNSAAALQNMVSQQNAALRAAAAQHHHHHHQQQQQQQQHPQQQSLGGAPLILSPRLQVPTSAAAAMLNGSGPPPLISAGDTQGLLYAQYAAAAADYANYSGLVSPLLADYSQADPSGGLFAR